MTSYIGKESFLDISSLDKFICNQERSHGHFINNSFFSISRHIHKIGKNQTSSELKIVGRQIPKLEIFFQGDAIDDKWGAPYWEIRDERNIYIQIEPIKVDMAKRTWKRRNMDYSLVHFHGSLLLYISYIPISMFYIYPSRVLTPVPSPGAVKMRKGTPKPISFILGVFLDLVLLCLDRLF